MGLREDVTDREGLTEPRLRSAQRWQGSGSAGSTGRVAAGRIQPGAEPGQKLLITPWVIYWTWGVVASVLTSQQLFKLMLPGLCNAVEELLLMPKPLKSQQKAKIFHR